jgi:hypothetical protein
MELGLCKYVGEVLIPNPSAQRDLREGFGCGRLTTSFLMAIGTSLSLFSSMVM